MSVPQAQPGFVNEDLGFDHTCTHCGGDSGDTDNNGHIVHCGFGSVYDEVQLIWLVRGDEVAKPGMLCDTCIDSFVAEGKLEAFSAIFGGLPDGSLSEAATREIFAYAARRIYSAFWREQGDHPYARRALDDEGEERIRRMRAALVGEMEVDSSSQIGRAKEARRAWDVGEAHAMSAISLGYGDEDPGFEAAAARWAKDHRAAIDAFSGIWNTIMDLDAKQNPRPAQRDVGTEGAAQ